MTPENRRLAQQELWVAEGSDWCWWYGPEHSTANDEEFDLLYRKHLSNIYRLLGGSPTDELAVPIKRPRVQALTVAPSAQIQPKIDGRVTTYFEWMGAGLCQPDYRSGSMHGVAQMVEALYYGYSDKAVYLRVDLGETFLHDHPDFEIRVNVNGESRVRLHAAIGGGAVKARGVLEGRGIPAGAPGDRRPGAGGVSPGFSNSASITASWASCRTSGSAFRFPSG